MKNLIVICALAVCCNVSLTQIPTEPHGEGSVVFESPGGKWQKAVITDQLTGESTISYSLEAETPAADVGAGRHPRIVLSCQQSGESDGVQIHTGTVIANQPHSISVFSFGRARASTRGENHGLRTWTADIAKDGYDFLIDKAVVSDFVAHKRIVIRFTSASGQKITDEYLTIGLSIESLRSDCPALFKKDGRFVASH